MFYVVDGGVQQRYDIGLLAVAVFVEKIKKKTSIDKEPSMDMLESRRSSFTALTLVIRMCSTSSIL